jgi:hypothetical protein
LSGQSQFRDQALGQFRLPARVDQANLPNPRLRRPRNRRPIVGKLRQSQQPVVIGRLFRRGNPQPLLIRIEAVLHTRHS